jgi:GDP-L-fucose synthase
MSEIQECESLTFGVIFSFSMSLSSCLFHNPLGSGTPFREFLHVDDMAEACVFVMKTISADNLYQKGISHINVGTGEDIPIRDLAGMIKDIVGFKGKIVYDPSKPDGMPKKLLDVSRLQGYGWKYKIGLEQGIREVYRWYVDEYCSYK